MNDAVCVRGVHGVGDLEDNCRHFVVLQRRVAFRVTLEQLTRLSAVPEPVFLGLGIPAGRPAR